MTSMQSDVLEAATSCVGSCCVPHHPGRLTAAEKEAGSPLSSASEGRIMKRRSSASSIASSMAYSPRDAVGTNTVEVLKLHARRLTRGMGRSAKDVSNQMGKRRSSITDSPDRREIGKSEGEIKIEMRGAAGRGGDSSPDEHCKGVHATAEQVQPGGLLRLQKLSDVSWEVGLTRSSSEHKLLKSSPRSAPGGLIRHQSEDPASENAEDSSPSSSFDHDKKKRGFRVSAQI